MLLIKMNHLFSNVSFHNPNKVSINWNKHGKLKINVKIRVERFKTLIINSNRVHSVQIHTYTN